MSKHPHPHVTQYMVVEIQYETRPAGRYVRAWIETHVHPPPQDLPPTEIWYPELHTVMLCLWIPIAGETPNTKPPPVINMCQSMGRAGASLYR